MRFYDDNKNAKRGHVGRSRTESAAICVLNMDIFFVAVTFRGQRLAGTYDPRRKVACQRWPKHLQQLRAVLGPMRRL